jgi:hypothetical protein
MGIIIIQRFLNTALRAAVLSSGGLVPFAKLLAAGGLFYHLYNQVR